MVVLSKLMIEIIVPEKADSIGWSADCSNDGADSDFGAVRG